MSNVKPIEKATHQRGKTVNTEHSASQQYKQASHIRQGNDEPSLLPFSNEITPINDTASIPQQAFLRGKWIEPNRKEEQYFSDLQAVGDSYGERHLDFDRYQKLQSEKRDKAEYASLLTLGSLLIDPKNPETQKNAYAVVSELRDVVEQQFRSDVQTQIMLRHILFSGCIQTKEELQFIKEMLRNDFVLPSNALWDPSGLVAVDAINAAAVDKLKENRLDLKYLLYDVDKAHAKFPSTEYSTQRAEVAKQILWKARIVQRIFPAMRDKTVEQISKFIKAYNAKDIDPKASGPCNYFFFYYYYFFYYHFFLQRSVACGVAVGNGYRIW